MSRRLILKMKPNPETNALECKWVGEHDLGDTKLFEVINTFSPPNNKTMKSENNGQYHIHGKGGNSTKNMQ